MIFSMMSRESSFEHDIRTHLAGITVILKPLLRTSAFSTLIIIRIMGDWVLKYWSRSDPHPSVNAVIYS